MKEGGSFGVPMGVTCMKSEGGTVSTRSRREKGQMAEAKEGREEEGDSRTKVTQPEVQQDGGTKPSPQRPASRKFRPWSSFYKAT